MWPNHSQFQVRFGKEFWLNENPGIAFWLLRSNFLNRIFNLLFWKRIFSSKLTNLKRKICKKYCWNTYFFQLKQNSFLTIQPPYLNIPILCSAIQKLPCNGWQYRKRRHKICLHIILCLYIVINLVDTIILFCSSKRSKFLYSSTVLCSNPILIEVFDLLLCQQYGYILLLKKSDDSLWSEINVVAAYINLYYAYINQWFPA